MSRTCEQLCKDTSKTVQYEHIFKHVPKIIQVQFEDISKFPKRFRSAKGICKVQNKSKTLQISQRHSSKISRITTVGRSFNGISNLCHKGFKDRSTFLGFKNRSWYRRRLKTLQAGKATTWAMRSVEHLEKINLTIIWPWLAMIKLEFWRWIAQVWN